MDINDIVQFWGRDQLLRWPTAKVANTKIPASAKDFLVRIGLPMNVDWTLRFDASPEQLKVTNGLFVIGYDDVMPICIDGGHGGKVFVVEHAGKRFMNSTIEQLGMFLMLYQQYRAKAKVLDQEQIMAIIDDADKQMGQLDSAAMANPDHYWPIVVEQMRDGLL